MRDAAGSILPISAIAMVALAGMVGGGVDMSRAYMVQNRLQNACDAGVLAGRRAVDGVNFTTAARSRAEDFFETNFDEGVQGVSNTTFTASSSNNGNTVDGTATTTVDTVIMQLFGFAEIPLSVDCSASLSVGNSDVVMVLDVTGSMGNTLGGQTRIESLRDAMKGFYDTVSEAADGTAARIRYGFVPYSAGVNVGQLLVDLDPSYIADTNRVHSKVPVFEETTVDTFAGWEAPFTQTSQSTDNLGDGAWFFHNGSFRNNGQCRNAQPNDTAWTNSGGTSTSTEPSFINSAGQRVTEQNTVQQQTRTQYNCTRVSFRNHWVIRRTQTRDLVSTVASIEDPIFTTTTVTAFDRWNHRAVDYDTSSYKLFSPLTTPTNDMGTDETATWTGCVEERETVSEASFSFSNLLGINPSGARDLDIDSAPTGDDATKWKPMMGHVAYLRLVAEGSNFVTSADESEWGFATQSFCPVASQSLQEMDEADFDAYADSLQPDGWTYHDIGMIWGARMASPDGIFAANVNDTPANGADVARHVIFMSDGQIETQWSITSPYGIEWHDRRVTDNGFSEGNARHTSRFLAVCEATRAKGIRVWVIAFGTALTTDLETCASDDSAFTAANSAQLNQAFQEIAKDVGELRITQ